MAHEAAGGDGHRKDMHGSSHRQGGAGDWSEDIETKTKGATAKPRARVRCVCS